MKIDPLIRKLLNRDDGLIALSPTYVHRAYRDGNRLGQDQLGLRTRRTPFVPERWIASSVEARNSPPLPAEGLSMLADVPSVSLRDAIRTMSLEMLGPGECEFRVLVKILDAGEPIPFHLHASDKQVRSQPCRFAPDRFGKDEAYYFLDAPRGQNPYTHVGLHRGVTIDELGAAVKSDRKRALELSPAIYQTIGKGFFLPASVPHRPGTALTLEMQQPSDVATMLETKRVSRRDLSLIDFDLAYRVGELKSFIIEPQVKRIPGGETAAIFPATICRKFSGDLLRARGTIHYKPGRCFALLVWNSGGSINGRRVKHGDEFFVPYVVAKQGIELRGSSARPLEVFTFFGE
jgi:mannose-6-phosphate isomerase class I